MSEQLNISITDESREAVSEKLNTILADEFVLYTKTHLYHWNVTGPHFNHLHKFLEEQYDTLAEITDEVAERVRMLGHLSKGSLGEFLKATRLKDEATTDLSAEQMLTNLLNDHEVMIRALREDIKFCEDASDVGSEDFLTGLIQQHEKMAWMLRASL